MELKDYYKMLEVSPDASEKELKRSYRRLAHLHHPDKNPEDPSAEAYFRELNEAYITLSDRTLRDKYNYERWSLRRTGKKYATLVFTAQDILAQCHLFREYADNLDIFRMNKEAFMQQFARLLSDGHLLILRGCRDQGIKRDILDTLLAAAQPLPLKQFEPLMDRLSQVAGEDALSRRRLANYFRQKKRSALWDRYKIGLISVISLLLCLLIYFLGKPPAH